MAKRKRPEDKNKPYPRGYWLLAGRRERAKKHREQKAKSNA